MARLISHNRLLSPLGSGGMGEVYAGIDETLKRRVALKAIRPEHRLSPAAKAQFLRANVASFRIKDLKASEYNPSKSNDNVTTFTTNDRNDKAKTYHYTVHATHTNGQTSTHDPKIENGG